jgi:hypothetical protein
MREEHRLKVFKNSVLRRIFGPKRDEMIGGWRKFHDEEIHNLYYSQNNTVKKDEVDRACRTHGGGRRRRRMHIGF